MSRSAHRKPKKRRASGDPRVDPRGRPRKQLRSYFVVLDSAIKSGAEALASAQGPVSTVDASRLVLLDRAVTILQASRVLLEEAHWEAASGVARQLFELLVNVEELASQPNTETAWDTYKSFGLMATARRRKRALDYAIALGFDDTDDLGPELDEYLRSGEFDRFRDKNGKLLDNWARRDVASLAAASKDNMRKAQYEYYYRSWSEHAHASPSSLLPAIITQDEDSAVGRITETVRRETRQLIVMMTSMFSDLILVLGQPQLVAQEQVDGWRDGLAAATAEWRERRSS